MFKGTSARKLFARFMTWLGTFTFIGIVVAILVSLWFATPGVPQAVILEINLEQVFAEYVPDGPLAQVATKDTNLIRTTVEALYRAAEDKRVVALIARVGNTNMGIAKIQEIRDAVLFFRKSGKPAIAWAETLGELSSGTKGYYLATAFDEFYLSPSGDVNITGLTAESPFFKGALDKLGVIPRMDHRYEYKNAMNLFTETKFTAAHREAMKGIIDSLFDQLVQDTARARKLSAEQMRQIFQKGPYLGTEAKTLGLIDGLKYRDEVYRLLRDKVGDKAKLLYVNEYRQRDGGPYQSGDSIALIYGVGAIHRGQSQYSLITGSSMGSDTVAKAFRSAIEDDKVKAIVFRIDSGGGSAVASDAIWRETLRAKEAGKPVIVSMSDVAGSGGYWVAMHANKIVAQPGTITGSIGVLGGKVSSKPFFEKLGVTFDKVQTTKNGTMWSLVYDYTPDEWLHVQAFLDKIYVTFTQRVADGRQLQIEQVRRIAKGRIWTGQDAKRLGLVDELGGLPLAIQLAKEAAHISADKPIKLVEFPKKSPPLKQLLGAQPFNSEETVAVEALSQFATSIEPLLSLFVQLGVTEQSGAVQMPNTVRSIQ